MACSYIYVLYKYGALCCIVWELLLLFLSVFTTMLLTICFYYKCCYCFVVFYNIVNLLHFYIFFFIIKQKNCKLCTNIYLFLFYSSLFQFLSFPYCNVLCLDTRDIFLRFYFVLVIPFVLLFVYLYYFSYSVVYFYQQQ